MEIQEIKAYMKAKKITYDELAERSQLSISTIKKIFSGISKYPRIDTIQTIERALGINENRPPLEITEGETEWIKLYHELTDENKVLLVKMISSFKDMPTDRRRFVLEAIRLALGAQK